MLNEYLLDEYGGYIEERADFVLAVALYVLDPPPYTPVETQRRDDVVCKGVCASNGGMDDFDFYSEEGFALEVISTDDSVHVRLSDMTKLLNWHLDD